MGAKRLAAAEIEGAVRDARRLLEWATGMSAARIVAAGRDPLEPEAAERFAAAIRRRAARQPVAQIVGGRDFGELWFEVTPDVLDPRPETEIVLAAAQGAMTEKKSPKIADLGVGSGCLLLSLLYAVPDASGIGGDISVAALKVARRNAGRLGVADRAQFVQVNWMEQGWTGRLGGGFDLVVSNPPYIATHEALAPDVALWEPDAALWGGEDGLSAYRAIARGAGALLKTGGALVLEIGAGQQESVAALMIAAGLSQGDRRHDFDNRVRALTFFAK